MTKLYIAIPCYQGFISVHTFNGILNLTNWCKKKSIDYKIQTLRNESLIPRARNTLVSLMLDDKDFNASHLLFIDSDIGFSYKNIQRLIEFDKDIVCGSYPQKKIFFEKLNSEIKKIKNFDNFDIRKVLSKSFNFNLNLDKKEVNIIDGFMKVDEAATGMMLIKKNVFFKMQKRFPERKYVTKINLGQIRKESENLYDLFATGVYKNSQYLSEDYYFSRLWSECGGEIWMDIVSPLLHFGQMEFYGDAASSLNLTKIED